MPCDVRGCVNHGAKANTPDNHMHRVPRNEPARSKWLRLIDRPDVERYCGLRICSLHFTPEDYLHDGEVLKSFDIAFKKCLKRGATPSQHLPEVRLPKQQKTVHAAEGYEAAEACPTSAMRLQAALQADPSRLKADGTHGELPKVAISSSMTWSALKSAMASQAPLKDGQGRVEAVDIDSQVSKVVISPSKARARPKSAVSSKVDVSQSNERPPSKPMVQNYCGVKGCGNRVGRHYHNVPSRKSMRGLWLKAIGRRADDPSTHIRVCPVHFAPEAYQYNRGVRRLMGQTKSLNILERDAVPTLFLPPQSPPPLECANVGTEAVETQCTSKPSTSQTGSRVKDAQGTEAIETPSTSIPSTSQMGSRVKDAQVLSSGIVDACSISSGSDKSTSVSTCLIAPKPPLTVITSCPARRATGVTLPYVPLKDCLPEFSFTRLVENVQLVTKPSLFVIQQEEVPPVKIYTRDVSIQVYPGAKYERKTQTPSHQFKHSSGVQVNFNVKSMRTVAVQVEDIPDDITDELVDDLT